MLMSSGRFLWRRQLWKAMVFQAVIWGSASVGAYADEVDTAVDAISDVGSISGISVGPDEADIIKSVVRCAINQQPMLNCARDEVIRHLPFDVQTLAVCITLGNAAEECASAEFLAQLPPDLRDLVTCITAQTNLSVCAQQTTLDAGQRQVLNVIDKLKADGRSELDNLSSGAIRNIMGVARGIRDDDWFNVAAYGGTEVYKAAAHIVLRNRAAAGGVAGPALDPVVDAIVQSRADVVIAVIKGARQGDARGVAETVTEVYLMQGVLVPCSIPGIPPDIYEATCGYLGKMVHAVGDIAGNLAEIAQNIIKSPLNAPSILWMATERPREIVAGKSDDCVIPEEYFATNYMQCFHRGAYLQLSNPAAAQTFVSDLNQKCRRYYDRCHFSDRFDGLCNPGRDLFGRQIGELGAALFNAAALYARTFPGFVREHKSRTCQPGVWMASEYNEFLDQCTEALQTQIPLVGDPLYSSASLECDASPSLPVTPSAAREACVGVTKLIDVSAVLQNQCRQLTPRPPTGCQAYGSGVCGGLNVKCDAPLPNADSFDVQLDNGGTGHSNRQYYRSGEISFDYNAHLDGSFTARVCSIRANGGGSACGESFPVELVQASRCAYHPPLPKARVTIAILHGTIVSGVTRARSGTRRATYLNRRGMRVRPPTRVHRTRCRANGVGGMDRVTDAISRRRAAVAAWCAAHRGLPGDRAGRSRG